jgi:Holliday junction DNA helicase RuvB
MEDATKCGNPEEGERLIVPIELAEDAKTDLTLRPSALDDFIGQDTLKRQLCTFLSAAKKRNEPIEHTLLYGPPGLGKTTLSHIIAREMGKNIRITSGPAIERIGDLAAILSNLEPGEILFIDEIHRLPKTIEEILYPAMEDFALDMVIGKGPAARTLRLDIPRFTLVGATTRLSLLSSPLRDRFGATYHLDYYSAEDMKRIIARSAKLLNVPLEDEAARELAARSRRTPRIGNRLLRRARDYAQVHGDGKLTNQTTMKALDELCVDTMGLDGADRIVLEALISKFRGGPVGIGTLAAASHEEVATLEEVIEPYLMHIGFLTRTPRGRVATEAAYKHLNVSPPSGGLV